MIVDLVRNDLSRVALKSSVATDELFGVYTFPKVHQMISTVSCSVNTSTTFMDIVRAAFPMGSMTGAPKIRAMQLIEKCEDFRRGLFSGTVGYISPDGDFDFNVVIRSIQYDAANNIIALAAGGAITFNSIPENEYEETILKLAPQLAALGISRDMWFKFINSKEHAK
jgi:para-aminobenzoate synthetase component 1